MDPSVTVRLDIGSPPDFGHGVNLSRCSILWNLGCFGQFEALSGASRLCLACPAGGGKHSKAAQEAECVLMPDSSDKVLESSAQVMNPSIAAWLAVRVGG
eukprot:5172832-Alexandrium_andersonii.AAC.1